MRGQVRHPVSLRRRGLPHRRHAQRAARRLHVRHTSRSAPSRERPCRDRATKQVVHIADITTRLRLSRTLPGWLSRRRSRRRRTILLVPMLKDNELIGAIGIYRQEVATVHRQADRAGRKLRRAGRHRHREHAAAQRAAPSRWSSRPRPPTCSRSSAARHSICKPCSTRWWSRPPGCARRTWRQSMPQGQGYQETPRKAFRRILVLFRRICRFEAAEGAFSVER